MADSTNVSYCDDYHRALFGGNLAASTVAPKAPEVEATACAPGTAGRSRPHAATVGRAVMTRRKPAARRLEDRDRGTPEC